MPHDNGSSASGRPSRATNPIERLGTYASAADVTASDPGFQEPEEAEESGDQDWIQNVEGRPSPFVNTWNIVYGNRRATASGYEIDCEEHCGEIIRMGSHFHETDAASTPHGKPRRPPVCHNVPWAVLACVLHEYARIAKRVHTPDYLRSVCWEISNLRPGHNGCNAAGTKVMAATLTQDDIRRAVAVIDNVTIAYEGQVYLS